MKCTSELQSISSFRLNLITKQQLLYTFVEISNDTNRNVIKFEPVDIKLETHISDAFDNFVNFGKNYKTILTIQL